MTNENERPYSFKKFSIEDGLAQHAQGMFKDASLVPALTQAKIELSQFIRASIVDRNGCLHHILERRIFAQETLLAQNLTHPLDVLNQIIRSILSSDQQLAEFVREIDQYYGEKFSERPYFQRVGQEANPEDPYTHESVRLLLGKLLANVNISLPKKP